MGRLARVAPMNNTFVIEADGLPITVGKDARVPEDHYRIILVRRGAVRFAFGGKETVVIARSLALVHPGAAFRAAAGAGAETAHASFSRGILDPAALGREAAGILQMLGITDAARRSGACVSIVRLGQDAFTEADSLFQRLQTEAREKRPGYETMTRLAFIELLMLLYRSRADTGGIPAAGAGRFRIEDAVAFVENRYSEELSLPGIAEHFGLNASYFSRLFARHTGMPLFSFVNRLRIQKSCVLLKRSGLSILEIAFSVGYNNLSHFNRYFRRVMGESPREYRKRARK
jgi:AraC-like DNA-binding protein